MNILDLNDDIMSKVKHNIFLKSLMKHRKDIFDIYSDWNEGSSGGNEYWEEWELENLGNCFLLDNGQWAHSADPEYWGEELYGDDWNNRSDLKLFLLRHKHFISRF